jgi:hypothetical protein
MSFRTIERNLIRLAKSASRLYKISPRAASAGRLLVRNDRVVEKILHFRQILMHKAYRH